MDEIGCFRISWKRLMNKKEGGKSQLDVGGKNSHRLSPIHYTSIAEIKGFRFKFRKDLSLPQRNNQENDVSSPRQASTESTAS
jgi:hypothetical protein